MSDASDESAPADSSDGDGREDAAASGPDAASDGEPDPVTPADADSDRTDEDRDLEALRREVEEKYDFEDFGPRDMAEMSVEEWEAAFDPETWLVGAELLDRVERDLKSAVARRDVFAVVERMREDDEGRLHPESEGAGDADGEPRVVAYSDEGYAVVYPDGAVAGHGTVLRDVKPVVALCSMAEYEPTDPPEQFALPHPDEVPESSGQLGNNVLQVVAAAQLLVGVGLLGSWVLSSLGVGPFAGWFPSSGGIPNIVPPVVGLFFVGVGLFLFTVVANARLSDRFRAEEYRRRLRTVGLDTGERPDFLPLAGTDDPPAVGTEEGGEAVTDGS
jgi:hypothetical protein